jgi:hypothetical protein
MENMEKKQCGDMCGCKSACQGGSCGGMQGMYGCHGGKRHLMKVVLKLLIVIIIFWCGFKLGVMTGFIRAEYGNGNGYRMMQGYNQ